MSYYGDRKRSLIEQKQQQWAKEREELARLSVPFGRTYKLDKNLSRAKNLSKYSNSEVSLNREEYNRPLPPISRNKSYDPDQYEVEGETSGYASDSAKEGSPEYYVTKNKKQSREPNTYQVYSNWNHRSSESDVSVCRDERPKWGDRGLGVAHFWEPQDINEQQARAEPPGWLQRGLKSDKEVLVVSHSPEQTPETGMERPYTGESSATNHMHYLRTHLRGQNIPLEPGEAAERERKRQKALELQNAIKQQLEEREIKRKQDREKKLREEAEEEDRIRRDQEIERQRVEDEQKMLNEKKERERKRNQAMQEALENAEKAAKLEKQKIHRMKSNVLNLPIIDAEEPEIKKETKPVQENSPSRMQLVPSPRNMKSEPPDRKSPENFNPNILPDTNFLNVPNETREYKYEPEPEKKPPENYNQMRMPDNLTADNLTVVLQNPFDSMQGMQLALLVPTMNVPTALPLAVPMSMGTSVPMSMGTTPEKSIITENRVLTPSVYRMRNRSCREISTQTESSYFRPESNTKSENFNHEENYGSLDRKRSSESGRKERRMRSEERTKEIRTEKPKWGANRPLIRYLKQSEKDPVYQKRKIRQKTRETIYEDKNNNYSQSSDDSIPQTPDHRVYRKQRNLWHKNERMISQNISVYQTEIVPLEMDRQGRLYVKEGNGYKEIQSARVTTTKQKYRDTTPDSSRRSERFTARSTDSRKERLNEKNERKKLTDKEESFDKSDNEEILDQITNLRHGLMLKQQQWDEDENDNKNSITRTKSAIEFPSVHDNP